MRLDPYIREALELLDAAGRDEFVVRTLRAASAPFEPIGFALQQGTEKRLKPLLSLHRQRPPHIHGILLTRLDAIGVDVGRTATWRS